jgi:hypothetical protein
MLTLVVSLCCVGFIIPTQDNKNTALRFSQPVTELRTRSRKIMFQGSKIWPVRGTDNLTASVSLLSK